METRSGDDQAVEKIAKFLDDGVWPGSNFVVWWRTCPTVRGRLVWRQWTLDGRTGCGMGRKERWRLLIYLLSPVTSLIINNCGVNNTNLSSDFIANKCSQSSPRLYVFLLSQTANHLESVPTFN